MCELFGLCANKPVNISFTWRGFKRRGGFNFHGWGVAWYLSDDKLAGLVKEPKPAPSSSIANLLTKGLRSHMVISHVRYKSKGSVSFVNTHPFVRRFGGRDWVFAHNGTLRGFIDFAESRLRGYKPVGDTDSEHAFCFILDELSRNTSDTTNVLNLSRIIWNLALRIARFGKFNFLLSNGAFLFAFMTEPNTLHYLIRHPPHTGYAVLRDDDHEIDLSLRKGADEAAVLVATTKLTNENWVTLRRNEMIVAHSGDILFKIKSNGELEFFLNEKEKLVLSAIRASPHCIGLSKLESLVNLPRNELLQIVNSLIIRGYLVKDSRYDQSDLSRARFYTNKLVRPVIDKVIFSR